MSKTPLLEALLRADNYPHPADNITLLETHISWVFLSGDYAYKIKKPLDLGFLDFSTLDKRRHCCYEELRLNQRLAPQLYLDVVAIHQQGDKIQISSDHNNAIEYAVQMRRFSQQQMLEHCLLRDEITPQQIEQFASKMAHFHQNITRATPTDGHGSFQCVAEALEENFHHIEQSNITASLNNHKQATLAQLQQFHDNIDQRQANGFIRECHGDLHLANLVVLDDQITPFDCIEFNPNFYWIDVISEIAFLIMDLQQRGYANFANQFLNQYLSQTGDYAGVVLLPLYLNYRAMVRAKISAIRLQQPIDPQQRLAEQALLESYLALAEHYCQPQKGALIITHGLSGSGKSWLCRQLSPHLNAIQIRSDVERKRLFSDLSKDSLYSAATTQATYHHLRNIAEQLICSGVTVLIDATCLQLWQRQLFQQLANQQQKPFLVLQLLVPFPQLEENIRQRQQLKQDPSEADLAVLAKQFSQFHPLAEGAELVNYHWGENPSTTLQAIQQKLGPVDVSFSPL